MPVPRLTFKLSLLLISLVMAAIALLGWSFSDVARSSFRQRLSFHRVHLVTFLAGEIAVSLEKSPPDTSRAMDMIDGLSKEVALSVTLRAADGTVIHHTGESPIPITSEALEAIRQTGFSLAPGLMMNYPALITVPVRRQRLDGYLQVGYPPALYGLPLEPLALRVGLVAMGLTLFSIVLAIWFTRPLRVLSASIQRIASGDLEHRVAITSRDEFGEVASAFNDMTSKLAAMLRAQQEFLAGVSHELRSPLARMRLTTEIARDQGSPTMSLRTLEGLEHDISELDRLISELLTASRLELSAEPLTRVPVPLGLLLQEVLSREAEHAERRRIDVRMDHGAEIVALLNVNKSLMVCAVGNLLNNAIKYSPEGASVSLNTSRREDWIRIDVEDRGIGIAVEDLDRVFEPFFRADRSRSRRTGGIGLGLMLVKRIVERHDGRVQVSSQAGQGSRFTIELPVYGEAASI